MVTSHGEAWRRNEYHVIISDMTRITLTRDLPGPTGSRASPAPAPAARGTVTVTRRDWQRQPGLPVLSESPRRSR